MQLEIYVTKGKFSQIILSHLQPGIRLLLRALDVQVHLVRVVVENLAHSPLVVSIGGRHLGQVRRVALLLGESLLISGGQGLDSLPLIAAVRAVAPRCYRKMQLIS